MTISPYEELQFDPNPNNHISENEWTNRIETAINNSVAAHKISDVEVCSFLSSGVDSSYIATIAEVNKTFTVGFDISGGEYSEIDYAKTLSEQIGAENYSKIIYPDEYWNAIAEVERCMDEPLADPSAVALYFLCKLASEHCKIVLSGEGADELFGGYNIYREPLTFRAYHLIPFPLRRLLGNIAAKLPPHRGLNFIVRRGKRLEDRYIGNAFIFSPQEAAMLLKEPSTRTALDFTEAIYQKISAKDAITRMQTLVSESRSFLS